MTAGPEQESLATEWYDGGPLVSKVAGVKGSMTAEVVTVAVESMPARAFALL